MHISSIPGSLAFTWKTGAPIAFAIYVQYKLDLPWDGLVVNPIWLFITIWIIPLGV
jgi:hypothetical protein